MSTRQYLNRAGVYAAPLFKRSSTTTTTMDNQNMNNDKFADIEDLLTDYLHLLENRLTYDDYHGDLSMKGVVAREAGSMIFPKLRTTQIEYHVRDVEDMISWLKDPSWNILRKLLAEYSTSKTTEQ
jgi:hypothetical protein